MWLIAFIGMATAFVESTLAQLYKVKDEDGNYRGGPAYYMERGSACAGCGVLLCLLLAFGLVFNAVQANSISLAMNVALRHPRLGQRSGAGGALRSHHLRRHSRHRPLSPSWWCPSWRWPTS
jgi:Na+/alanine symporter